MIIPENIKWYDSTAFETGKVIKASTAKLLNVRGYNKNAAKRWVMIFNTSAIPADGVFCPIVIPVEGQNSFYWESGMYPKVFQAGISICISTTDATKTLGAADLTINATYI